MSNKLTYIEARDKIWNAYFKDEIEPLDANFCFCGTLCENKTDWFHDSPEKEHKDYGSYTGKEYGKMEFPMLNIDSYRGDPDYEDRLFEGLLESLEVLKQIHRERGEVIPEDEPLLTKRKLVTV